MHNEQRTQATLDFATRNAFETLNKFAQWASTPNAEVQFNLIDTIATLSNDNSGANARGIFLKPVKIPSLNSVTTGIFGPIGTDAIRNMYWNINFQSNGSGWVFENYSQGSNSSGPKANNKAELKILVNTIFGSDTKAINITNRNVSVSSYNYSEAIYGSNSLIKIVDDNSKERIVLGSTSSLIASDNISLGNDSNSSLLSGNFGKINIYNQNVNRNILSFVNTSNGNTVSIGFNDNSNTTQINGGSLLLVGNSNQTSGFSILSQIRLIDAIYNKSFDIGIAIPLVDGLVSTVNIGADNPSSVTSTTVLAVSTLNIGATSSVNLYTGTGAVFTLAKDGNLSVEGNQKVHGSLKTEVSSGSAVYVGIDEGDGITSKEISVTKGQVLIPNLYLSKKSNYVLSGIKHVSLFNTNPSIKFIPIKKEEIQNNTSLYSCEYTTKIQHTPTIRTAKNEFDTTINNLSGTLNSYIAKYSSDTAIEILAAPVATTGANQDKTITSAYTAITVTGLSSLKLPAGSANRLIKLWSTPNYMYVFILNSSNEIETYYSSDAINFSKLGTPIALSYPEFRGNVVMDIDSITQTTIDYMWISLITPCFGSRIDYDVPGKNNTTVTISLINNCGVAVIRKHNISQSQLTFVSGDDTLIRSGETTKIVCVAEGSNLDVNSYVVEQYCGIHTDVKKSKKSLFSSMRGAVVGGALGGFGGALAGVVLSGTGSNSTSRTTSERVRIVVSKYSVNQITNSIDRTVLFSIDDSLFIRNGFVADLDVTPATSPSPIINVIVNAYYSRPTDTYKITFDNSAGSPYAGTAGSVAVLLLDNSQGLEYSGVSFVKSTFKTVKKILTGSTNLWLNTGTGYNQIVSAQVHDKMKILDDNVFAYFNSSTNAIQYYSTDSTPGIPLTSIQTYNVVSVKDAYNIYGMYVDYVSLTGNQFDGYNSFILSNTAQNNGTCQYNISTSDIESVGDREVSIETSANSEVVSIIDRSSAIFAKRNIGKLAKITGPSNYILASSSKNAEYDDNYNLLNTTGSALNNVPLISAANWSLNVHLEPISYILKNRNNSVNSASVANYYINSTSTKDLYLVSFVNNPYSGYRVSYKADDASQIEDSNITNTGIFSAPLGVDDENLNQYFYVSIGDEYTTVIRSDLTDAADISEISSRVFKSNHRIIKMHNSLIDPLNSLFDPTISIVNEFGNVVSVRMDAIAGFRSGPVLGYNNQIVVGLTEVASTGEPCT